MRSQALRAETTRMGALLSMPSRRGRGMNPEETLRYRLEQLAARRRAIGRTLQRLQEDDEALGLAERAVRERLKRVLAFGTAEDAGGGPSPPTAGAAQVGGGAGQAPPPAAEIRGVMVTHFERPRYLGPVAAPPPESPPEPAPVAEPELSAEEMAELWTEDRDRYIRYGWSSRVALGQIWRDCNAMEGPTIPSEGMVRTRVAQLRLGPRPGRSL